MNVTSVQTSRRALLLGGLGVISAGAVSMATAAPAAAVGTLRRGSTGADVVRLQQTLTTRGYWCGRADGDFGHLTQQAVWALQKRHGLTRDAVVGAMTRSALANDTRLTPVGGSGNRVEVHLSRQLVLVVRSGRTLLTLNTSTGNGEPFVYNGRTIYANTPRGTYSVYSTYSNGWQTGSLGRLWRPMYFRGGIALHGSTFIPPYPDSHGCARLSTAAMNLVWANGYLGYGGRVIVT